MSIAGRHPPIYYSHNDDFLRGFSHSRVLFCRGRIIASIFLTASGVLNLIFSFCYRILLFNGDGAKNIFNYYSAK